MSAFIEVKLNDWDCEKVTIGLAPGGKEPTVLYDKKIPILTIAGTDPRNMYVVTSYDGLKRNMKYDSNAKKFLDVWEGDWSVNFKVADTYDGACGLQKKVIDIFKDIVMKTTRAYGKAPAYDPIGVKYIMEKNEYGVEIKKGIDPTKPVYLKVKIGYDAPSDAIKTFDAKLGKEVPIMDARFPKADFYDVKRAKDEMKIKKPDTECRTGMKAVPKFIIGLYKAGDNYYITRRLRQCYYEPASMGGGGMDEDLAAMLRDDLDLNSQY